MINLIKNEAQERMEKTLKILNLNFSTIRSKRVHKNMLDNIIVDYNQTKVKLRTISNITVENSNSLLVSVFDKSMIKVVEKAIISYDITLNPNLHGCTIRIPMPALTEDTRKKYIKQARSEAEKARISIRNIRRDLLSQLKLLQNKKKISEDDEKYIGETIKKLTDKFIIDIDKILKYKESDLMVL